MKTNKLLLAGLVAASMLVATGASAQVATTTGTGVGPTGQTAGVSTHSGADLAVSISGSGIVLSAASSNVPISVTGLPLSLSGALGGSCQLNLSGNAVGTIGTTGVQNFTNAVVVPAGSSVTLPVTCTGATAGNYTVTINTAVIPATISGGSTSITPRGIGGGADNDTTAVGTLTITSGGTVGGITPAPTGTGTTGGTTGSGTGSVLGTSTSVPNVPNTGAGGDMAMNLAILAFAAVAAALGMNFLRRRVL
jgi:hypothetical protein